MKRILMLTCCLALSLGSWGCVGVSGVDELPSDFVVDGALSGDPAAGDVQLEGDAELEDAEEDAADIASDADADADEELSPVEITTDAVHAGKQGVSYAKQKISASGGSRQYRWEVAGTLPAGLEVKCYAAQCSGELVAKTIKITGTPTEAGSFAIVVTATDVEDPSLSDEAAYTIEIASKPVEQNGELGDRIGLVSGANLQAIGANFQASLAPALTIKGKREVTVNVEKIFPSGTISGLLVEPLEIELEIEGGAAPYHAEVPDLDAGEYEVTWSPGGTIATIRLNVLYPELRSAYKDPMVPLVVGVTDANGKQKMAIIRIRVRYPDQNINQFTVNACTKQGFMGVGAEDCDDHPSDLSLTFYRNEKAMVTYNHFSGADGMQVAYGGIAVPMTEVDRITADEVFVALKTTHERFTKITLRSAYWWAEYVPAGGEISFSSETDILEQMTGWVDGDRNLIWHRIGNKATTPACDLTEEELNEGVRCL